MAAVLALPPSLRSGWPLYLWGGLTATSVEYIYHWWGETFLSVSFWDYTGVFGNLRGRVCLPFSLDAAGAGAGGPCSRRRDMVAVVGLYRRRGVLPPFFGGDP